MVNEERRKIQLEAFEALKENNFNGCVIMPTGSGKTWDLIECLKYLDSEIDNILYCCDNKKLRDEDFPNQLVEWGGEQFLERMDRMCYQSAYKLFGKHYTIGLFDEADYSLTEKYSEVYKNNTFKYKILVSATLDADKKKLLKEIVPIVYEKKISDIDGVGIVNKANLYVVNYLLLPEENRKYLGYNEGFKKLLSKSKPNAFALRLLQQGRKRFLGKLKSSQRVCYNLVKELYTQSKNNKILIFCLLSEQADEVAQHSYHSKNESNDNLSKFDKGEIRILSVVGKIDRGINLDSVNKGIFEAPLESVTKLVQRSGRLRRLNVNDTADLYFLIPYYKTHKGEVKPTIVQKWVINSTKDFDTPLLTYKFK